MAEFMSELQGGLRPSYSSFSFLDNPIPSTPLCNETNFFFFPHELPLLQPQDVTGAVPAVGVTASADGCLGGGDGNNDNNDIDINRNKKKKTLELSKGSCSASAKSSGDPVKRRKHHGSGGGGGGRGKKIKGDGGGEEEEDGGRKEVVHVRARRGQATDSHSLAERVRRGKINERLRCLQDIVPGCYKTMGLAVMLDEIINYVQSLQHQVEFLSMKLTAASSFYDFNSESDLIDVMRRAKAYEAKEAEKQPKGGQLEGHSANTTTTNTTTTTTTSNLISAFHPFDHIL